MNVARQISRVSMMGLAGVFFGSVVALAAGLEAPTMSSARYAPLGGAGVSDVRGAEGLYYNPAGTVWGSGGFSATFAPTIAKIKAPITAANTQTTSESIFIPFSSAYFSYKATEDLAAVAGIYAGGGGAYDFGNVDFGIAGTTLKPRYYGKLQILEGSLGAAYKIMPGLSVGAAWRILFSQAETHKGGPTALGGATPDAILAFSMTGLSNTNLGGFRVGAQYREQDDKWGVGASFRNSVPITLTGGKVTGTYQFFSPGVGAETAMTGSEDGTLSLVLPWQIDAGGHFWIGEKVKALAHYSFTKYSDLHNFDLTGTLGGTSIAANSQKLEFKDRHGVGVGAELHYLEGTPIRVGYGFMTQVTNSDYPSINIPSPGVTHYVSAGAEHKLTDSITVLGAVAYTFVSGSSSSTNPLYLAGNYDMSMIAAHLGFDYAF